MSDLRFADQDFYEELFSTEKGWIVVAAEVQGTAERLTLSNIVIEPLDTRFLAIGMADVLRIRKIIERTARQEGYTHLEISGIRISGANPDRPICIERRLS